MEGEWRDRIDGEGRAEGQDSEGENFAPIAVCSNGQSVQLVQHYGVTGQYECARQIKGHLAWLLPVVEAVRQSGQHEWLRDQSGIASTKVAEHQSEVLTQNEPIKKDDDEL